MKKYRLKKMITFYMALVIGIASVSIWNANKVEAASGIVNGLPVVQPTGIFGTEKPDITKLKDGEVAVGKQITYNSMTDMFEVELYAMAKTFDYTDSDNGYHKNVNPLALNTKLILTDTIGSDFNMIDKVANNSVGFVNINSGQITWTIPQTMFDYDECTNGVVEYNATYIIRLKEDKESGTYETGEFDGTFIPNSWNSYYYTHETIYENHKVDINWSRESVDNSGIIDVSFEVDGKTEKYHITGGSKDADDQEYSYYSYGICKDGEYMAWHAEPTSGKGKIYSIYIAEKQADETYKLLYRLDGESSIEVGNHGGNDTYEFTIKKIEANGTLNEERVKNSIKSQLGKITLADVVVDKKATLKQGDVKKNWNDRLYQIDLYAYYKINKDQTHNPLSKVEGVIVKDYISNHFDLVDASGKLLEIMKEPDEDGLMIGEDEIGVYVEWTNVSLSCATKNTDSTAWHQTIYLKAKPTFIGNNNVSTNIASGSGVTVPNGEEGNFIQFPEPKVNVKIDLSIDNVQDVMFKGDSYTLGDFDDLFTVRNRYNLNNETNVVTSNVLEYKCYSDMNLQQLMTLPKKIYENTTYYVQAKYNDVVKSDDKSKENTSGYENILDSIYATNVDDRTKEYGILDVKVVAGQLAITKTINEQYVDQATSKHTNATQTFVFRIDQYTDNTKSTKVKTFYQTITFVAREQETSMTKYISELEKGYYEVTEETNWSSKYDIDNPKNETQGGEIGKLLPVDDETGKKTFSGLDSTDACGYKNFAAGENMQTNFVNNLKTWNKWYSDVATAKNKLK